MSVWNRTVRCWIAHGRSERYVLTVKPEPRLLRDTRGMPVAVRAMVHRGPVFLVIGVLLLAACAKRSVAPVTALVKRPRTMAIGGATPPSISEAPPCTEASRANPTYQRKKAVAASKR